MRKLKYQKGIVGLLLVLGIANIVYFAVCFLTFHLFVNFSEFFLVLGVVFIIGGILKANFHRENSNKLTIKLIRVLKIIIGLFAVSFILIEGCIIVNGSNSYNYKKPDYIMILGGGIRGKNMLLIQLERTQEALKYIRENPNTKVIVSGGQGKGESISEAEAMRVYLVNHGVNNNNIIKEEKSKTTMENMKYTRKILNRIDGRKNVRLAIVTSNFHVFRAKFLARRCGFEAEGIAAPVTKLLIPNYFVREYFAVVKSFIFDR
ncbi:MAG: YdcF family protein [Clostridium sp.]|nr:YdcF family protein [Clostridium sp.]